MINLRALLVLAVLLLFAAPARAAIAHDATTNATPITSGTTISFSHTCTGSDLVLIVKVGWRKTGPAATVTVTYNSVSMTQLRASHDASDGAAGPYSNIFYLAAPATGSNTVLVTFSAAPAQGFASASSYTGVDQSTPMDVSGGAGTFGTGTSQSHSITTATDNAWVVDSLASQDESPAMTGASGRTERTDQTSGSGDYNTSDKGAITPAGSVTMDWTTSGSIKWTISLAALRPAGAAPPRSRLVIISRALSPPGAGHRIGGLR